jgi:hypothetical protein
VGLDCEWRPSSSWSGDDDHPVATLQLATREEVFVIDMQTLCSGDNTGSGTHTNPMNVNSHSDRFPVRVIETEAEAALCAALGELFTHRHIAILGFSVGVDLQKLAASFPQMPCFGRVMNVVDLAPLTRHAFPPTQRSSLQGKAWKHSQEGDLSLSKLCLVALGRRLDKTQQCSPWHERPLTNEQVCNISSF